MLKFGAAFVERMLEIFIHFLISTLLSHEVNFLVNCLANFKFAHPYICRAKALTTFFNWPFDQFKLIDAEPLFITYAVSQLTKYFVISVFGSY